MTRSDSSARAAHSSRRGGLLWTSVVLLAAGCAGGGGEPTPPQRESPEPAAAHQPRIDRLADEARFLSYIIGKRFEPGDDLEAAGEGRYRLREPLRVGGRRLDEVVFVLEEGALARVELRVAVQGAEEARKLAGWVDRLCAPFTERVELEIPSPLGTPPEGEESWDPAQISEARCGGAAGGVEVSVRESQSFDSKHHDSRVTVSLTPVPTGEP